MNNNQQLPNDFYAGYASATSSHSPNPSRPGYATTNGVPSALNGRRSQPNGDANSLNNLPQPVPTPAHLYGGERFSTFDPRNGNSMTTQPIPPSPFNMFGTGNQTPWSYNIGSAATMNGPINDGSRMRQSNRRPALHTEWTTNNDVPLPSQPNPEIAYFPPTQHIGMPSTGSPDPFGVPPLMNIQGYGQAQYGDNKKDTSDLIPTAIVIKNIPFNVRREYLMNMMVDLHLPQPYAFNYHFDQGVFRGLAFANFQSAQDTAMVIERLNGMDVYGRKLRVEYKKMLPEHERERIEREKREKRGQLEEQHRSPAHQVSMSSMATATSVQRSSSTVQERNFDLNDPHTLRYYLELYMFHNDDNKELHIFPADIPPEDRRLIHILAHNMGLEHTSIGEGGNRQIHVSKSKFNTGLRQSTLQQPGVNLDGHPRGLSRAATYDFNDRQQQLASAQLGGRANLVIPNGSSPDSHQHSALRGAKSFTDLRSYSPSPSASMVSVGALGPQQSNGHSAHNGHNGHNGHNAGGAGSIPFLPHFLSEGPFGSTLVTPTTPASTLNPPPTGDVNGLVNSLGSLGLGSSSFDGSNGHSARPRDTPGAIGSQRPSANSNNVSRAAPAATAAVPERQPRGPGGDWGDNASGFARARPNGNVNGNVNGHTQHGSDSSEANGRAGTPHGSTRF